MDSTCLQEGNANNNQSNSTFTSSCLGDFFFLFPKSDSLYTALSLQFLSFTGGQVAFCWFSEMLSSLVSVNFFFSEVPLASFDQVWSAGASFPNFSVIFGSVGV